MRKCELSARHSGMATLHLPPLERILQHMLYSTLLALHHGHIIMSYSIRKKLSLQQFNTIAAVKKKKNCSSRQASPTLRVRVSHISISPTSTNEMKKKGAHRSRRTRSAPNPSQTVMAAVSGRPEGVEVGRGTPEWLRGGVEGTGREEERRGDLGKELMQILSQ